MKTNFIRAILLCGSAMTVACPAIAQAREPAEAASQAAPRADSAVIGEVVVTARRRDERLQDVPVSVTALSAEALERSSVQELRSIGVLSPGLTFTNEGGGGNATLSLRGIGQIPLGEGTPGVVIYVNNMALPPDGSNVPTYDIASIQVLKGPQGTLFGKNTLGGAVLVSSKAPDYHFGGYVEGTYGRFDYREIQGAVNIPLVEDKVALRIAGQIRRQDPRTGSFDGGPGFDNIHQDGVRVSLLVEPVEGLKSTTIAEYYKRHERFAGTYLIRQNFPFGVFFGPALGPILDAQVAPEVAKQHANPRSSYDGGVNGGSGYTRSKSITNDTIYKLSDSITVRNIFSYREQKFSEGANTGGVSLLSLPIGPGGAGIPFALFYGFTGADREYLTNETQILGDVGRVNYIAGFYYNNDKPHGLGGSGFTAFSIGALPSPPVTSQVENNNKAIYGQIGFKITDQLTLNLGGRYSWDKASACGGNVFAGSLATDAECRTAAARNNPNDGIGTVSNSSKQPAYTIGLDYRVSPDWMVYAQHRRGFRAANVNTPFFETWYTTCTGTPVPGGACFDLRPFQRTGVEKLLDVEVGSKLTFDLGGARGHWNLAAFRDKYKNALQFLNTQTLVLAPPGASVPDSPTRGSVGINVADETIWGIETDFSIAPTQNFNVSLSGAYTNVSVDSISLPPGFPPSIFSKQNVNKYAPTFSGTIAASWTLPIHPLEGDVVLNADLFTTDDFAGQGGEKLPGYQLANARLDWKGVRGTGLDLSLFVRNLTNEQYFTGAAVLLSVFPTSTAYLGAPRTWGVSGRYRF